MPTRTLAALAVLYLCAASPARADLLWKGAKVDPAALPEGLAPEVGRAAAPWVEWAGKRGYHLWISDAGDCILLAERRWSGVGESLDLIAATIAAVDRFLPARSGGELAAAPRKAPTTGTPLEEFDLPPAGAQGPSEVPRTPHQVPVLFAARNPSHYKEGLAKLVEGNAWMTAWAEQIGRASYGLTLPEPLIGAWLIEAPENEEWDPRNELVHRLAQLLVMDRAGRVPYWMLVGTAWNVELEVRGGIYCFPYRAGFVGIGEHGGWAPALRSRFRGADAPEVDAAAVCALERGIYVDRHAATAWGTLRWLIGEQRAVLPVLMADFDAAWRQGALEVAEDGSWRSLPLWQWPLETQADLLRKHLGRDVWTRLGQAFRGES
ncbi:MAG TPA: hypothetical protein VMT18_00055 [Planctomycetota bacterium]|nr:hypothetical protein [Planctomycetota bacterium]